MLSPAKKKKNEKGELLKVAITIRVQTRLNVQTTRMKYLSEEPPP